MSSMYQVIDNIDESVDPIFVDGPIPDINESQTLDVAKIFLLL